MGEINTQHIEFSLNHSLLPGVGIGTKEIQTLECVILPDAVLDEVNGFFRIYLISESILVHAMTTLSELETMMTSSFSKVIEV